MTELSRNDLFGLRLKNSLPAVLAVAGYLLNKGYDVAIPAPKCAPTTEERWNYLDNGGDIVATKDGKSYKLGVKHGRIMFTSAADYPAIHNPHAIMFSNVAAVQRNPDVDAYFMVNRDRTHAAVINHDTKDKWLVRETFARNIGHNEVNYHCPVEYAKFIRLAETVGPS
jgi:hypothetical protein